MKVTITIFLIAIFSLVAIVIAYENSPERIEARRAAKAERAYKEEMRRVAELYRKAAASRAAAVRAAERAREAAAERARKEEERRAAAAERARKERDERYKRRGVYLLKRIDLKRAEEDLAAAERANDEKARREAAERKATIERIIESEKRRICGYNPRDAVRTASYASEQARNYFYSSGCLEKPVAFMSDAEKVACEKMMEYMKTKEREFSTISITCEE